MFSKASVSLRRLEVFHAYDLKKKKKKKNAYLVRTFNLIPEREELDSTRESYLLTYLIVFSKILNRTLYRD